MRIKGFVRAVAVGAIGAAAFVSGLRSASAAAYSFGVISDTQQTQAGGLNTVPTQIIAAVNQQFINRGVSFVLQPGDLCDDGSLAGLQTRLDANAALNAAGIPYYALRGNHDDGTPEAAFFQSHYIPSSGPGVTVHVAPYDCTTYSVTINNTKFIMLDIDTADSTAAMDSATTWMAGELAMADHTQAFVLQHKDLLGQNHKDNAFGSSNDANPAQQNAFFAVLAQNNVKYDICGHDHMNHRSIVTSPDGLNKAQEIITQSDSTKFYTASSGFSTRETSISDQQNKIGYYIFTVDGPRVTAEYWATTPVGNDIPANPVWTLQDKFGYSLNGKQFTIARGASYAGIADCITAGGGFYGTHMHILGGTNSATATAEGSRAESDDVNTGWTERPYDGGFRSDILTLWGMNDGLGSAQTDTFALSMEYDPRGLSQADLAAGKIALMTQNDAGQWVNAVDLNFGGSRSFVFGAWDSSYALGTYGIDQSTSTVWAVVNHNSNYVAGTVPEPGTLFLIGTGLIGAFGYMRRRMMK